MDKNNEKIERRVLNLNVRAAEDGEKKFIEGDAAVFNQETVIGDWFREMIDPGAFKRVLAEKPDVIAAYNHNWDVVLARTTNGTLTLEETDASLRYRAEINPNDPEAISVYEKVKRGDVPQASFAFTVRSEEWVNPPDRKELPLRRITEVDELYDVGPCTFGAYPQASAQARSKAVEFQTVEDVLGQEPVAEQADPQEQVRNLRRRFELSV
jgi:HK97 family phage prohead protease